MAIDANRRSSSSHRSVRARETGRPRALANTVFVASLAFIWCDGDHCLGQSHYRCLVSADEYGPWDASAVSEVQAVFGKARFDGGLVADVPSISLSDVPGEHMGTRRRSPSACMWPNFERSPSHGTSKLLRGILSTWRDRALNSENMKIICGAGRIAPALVSRRDRWRRR